MRIMRMARQGAALVSFLILVLAVFAGMARADVVVLQAEDWMVGGNSVGYYDDADINGWGTYRSPDTADVEGSGDSGGWSVGWTNAGEWLILTTNPLAWNQAPTFAGGDYMLYYRVASGNTEGTFQFHVEIDGTPVDTSNVGPTGGWLTWTTVTSAAPVSVGAGTHEIKFVCDTGGFNINWLALSNEGEPAAPVDNTPVVLAPNGSGGFNAYKVVNAALPFADAKAAAGAMTFPGLPGVAASSLAGHLATFSSEGEFMGMNGAIRQNESDPWIGMTDDENILPGASEFGNTSYNPDDPLVHPVPQNGSLPSEVGTIELGAGMRMVDGTPFTFHRKAGATDADPRSVWSSGEPNDYNNNEDGIQLTSGGGLNDNNVASSFRYVVEWDVNLADMPRIGPAGGMGYFGVRELAIIPNQPNTTYEAVAALYNDDQNNTGNPLYRRAVRVDGKMPVINCEDPDEGGGGGSFGGNIPFLSNRPGVEDNFVLRANGIIQVPEAGEWTFYGRGDDGLMIRIPGQTWNAVLASENNTGFVEGDSLVFNNPTGNSNLFGTITLAAGNYPIEITWFEAGGGANVEVAAAKGNTTDLNAFRIIGHKRSDIITPGVTADGWMVQTTAAGGSEITSIALAEAELAAENPTPVNAAQINYGPTTGAGRIGGDANFPNGSDGGDSFEDFALFATATLDIPVDGIYRLGFQGDDGGYLRVIGQTFTSLVENATGVAVIDEGGQRLLCDTPTGDSSTVGEINLLAGQYAIEALFFERGGGDNFEVFAGITNTIFSSDPVFRLLTANGASVEVDHDGLQLVPEPSSIILLGFGLFGLLVACRRRRA